MTTEDRIYTWAMDDYEERAKRTLRHNLLMLEALKKIAKFDKDGFYGSIAETVIEQVEQ